MYLGIYTYILSNFVFFGAIPHLFERLFLISWENNRDCHITMLLSLKTMEVQIKGDQCVIRDLERCRSTAFLESSI